MHEAPPTGDVTGWSALTSALYIYLAESAVTGNVAAWSEMVRFLRALRQFQCAPDPTAKFT
jgi:hypothetical protein